MAFRSPKVVLRDPKLIKVTCVRNYDYFQDHQTCIDEEMGPLFEKNVFSLRGDHRKLMRNTLSPSFIATRMKFIFELIVKCSRDFVHNFIDHPDEAKSIETKECVHKVHQRRHRHCRFRD